MSQTANKPTKNDNNVRLVAPSSEADFEALAQLKALAFAEKSRGCGGVNLADGVASYRRYAQHHPAKLEHCRMAKSSSAGGEASDAGDDILGAIQLQLPGDPGDMDMPDFLRHRLQSNEAYIEYIACHPQHTGKGVGSKLLAWADTYCRERSDIGIITLEVMTANMGAFRLYERKGFVMKRDPHTEDACEEYCINPLVIFCCLGCRYCGIRYMEKDLSKDAKATVAPPPGEVMSRDTNPAS